MKFDMKIVIADLSKFIFSMFLLSVITTFGTRHYRGNRMEHININNRSVEFLKPASMHSLRIRNEKDAKKASGNCVRTALSNVLYLDIYLLLVRMCEHIS
jgi:hypothetical protein